MAGRRFSLFRLLRRKRNRRGPGAAPAQQAEEPLQQDPGQDRTEEKDRPRGRFRRAVQRLLKIMRIRRRTPRTTAPELMAQPETRPAELKEKPEGSTELIDHTATSETAETEDTTNPDTALADLIAKDITEATHGTAEPDTALAEDPTGSDTAATDVMAKADMAPMAIDGSSHSDLAPMDGTAKPDTALAGDTTGSNTDLVAQADITPMLTEGTASSDEAPMDDTANPETAMTDAETTTSDLMAEGDTTSEDIGNTDTTPAESVTDAPNLHILEGKGVSSWKPVPDIVWSIHHNLTFHVSPHNDICRLAEAHPRDVVMTLLRCAPECDRAAAVMWRSISSSGTAMEKVLPVLLQVTEDWPVHGMSTSDGDNRDVFALAATLALWLIIQEPKCQDALMNYIPRLLVALLFQVFMSTEQVPEEVNTFWTGCLEQHRLPTQPNRFLVETIKALLCHLPWEDIWMARKRRLAWDPLRNSDTHHYAVGLHVREMRRQLTPSHSPLAIHLLGLLSSEDPRWELPALEFLVQLLDYLDARRCHSSVEQILSRHLQSECPERRRLALRGRMVLWMDLSMAESICSLSQHLLELLPDEDGELVVMTLSVFVNMLRDKDIRALISTAPKLAEALRPLFDNLSSFCFFQTLMEVLVEGGTRPLEMQMHQILVLWFFLHYDEHQCVAEVPTIVRSMHQCLTSHMAPGVTMHTNICRLAEAHPHDVVMTLLRCAPECDRAAAMMWRSIGSSGTTVEKVLPVLLRVMEDWPVHGMSTSDGDSRDVFAVTATLALWLIIQEPKCQDTLMNYIPRLLMALLFQVSMSTEQVPEEVNSFWRGCLEQHRLPTQPNRFFVQTIKAMLCRLQWDNEVVSVERKCGWDTLLCADTQHYAVGLLAREMRHVLVPFYSPMAIHLLGLLSTQDPCWELPALAFLVEVLDFLDGTKCRDRVLPILSRNLQNQCPERQRLALRGLLVLAVDPSMAESICSLSQHLLELLPDADGELVVMTLSVFESVLRDEDIRAFVSTAPRLAEALRPLFDNDNTHVQLLSIRLFRELMEVLAEDGTQLLETQVHQSLVPLFIHGQDENQCVAEASREVLLCAARFLKRRDLEKLLRKEQHFKFCDCLMDKDVSRRAEHLHQALPYLQSPQQPLREAAVRFMGIAAWHMQDLQLLMRAFEAMSQDDCPSYCTMRTEFLSAFRRAVTK
ncbi:maestro heat-like repeat family member 5 isoform X12 [Manacus candei]|uniref:maestro heat-like repeat family member 5 isoform X12 n=1 Tax=Manacus candei TaxID=415023 RepID=UPI002225CA03|nr:maestro heat-like repeat family member 5 isoform X12 [Manacus candei]